ncbi:MAG: hypothetical protein P0Y53_14135 [Candidatus Pseudobacter hemicellulosilyticus]|uniref:Uncharacterized protein n=1 Tax=Candidatus Pseudobacter hemicellulosilyticus TaxID=3121375 RepID=A0AAJ5WN35_9BACT|nr:MAG: hypothetical protein P0Y53_14135 [Pseudobacter sp.]
MKKIFCLGIAVSCFIYNVSAQKIDDDPLVDSIKAEITRFFIGEGLLDKGKVKGSLDYVYVSEINKKRSIGYDANGIYRIGIHRSHSPEYIMIKEDGKYVILGFEKFSKVLKEVIFYSERNKCDSELLISYVESVIEIYKYNSKSSNFKLNQSR